MNSIHSGTLIVASPTEMVFQERLTSFERKYAEKYTEVDILGQPGRTIQRDGRQSVGW
jgi:hypothetical protein